MELVDVEYRREGQGWVLRLFIDKEGGVTVDDCATVSREVSRFLDVEDSIDHAFSLEVSSPGLERPLKKDADFLRFAGRKIRLRLRDATGPDRVLVGILEGMEDARVVLTVEGHRRSVAKEQIAKARLVL
ncbi:MAG: ribosome maturation factor RimP [Desulfobulbus propionicus]|nr:MAG: ribosome maturation factor RimP [Desulfobulbus propionicus]